jgi:nitrogen regulatory protein PII
MNNENSSHQKVVSPSRAVWKTQLNKGTHSPHRVSRITCIVNKLFSDRVVDQIFSLGINSIFVETGRNTREFIQPRKFGLPGKTITLQNTPVDVFRFTVQRKQSKQVMDYLVKAGGFDVPGRGSIFAQDLIEFTKKEPAFVTFNEDDQSVSHDIPYLHRMSYVICVLSVPGSGDKLAKVALDLGVCVPLITHGTSSDLRDQLGLIRITISPEKEVVHLVMPEQDAESIVKLLLEEGRLDRPGRGYIYQTPISYGLVDTRLRMGRQEYAASMEQIIAAIDQVKGNTVWRKRLDTGGADKVDNKLWLPNDSCEISVVSDEDTEGIIKKAGMKAGATSSTVSRVKILMSGKQHKVSSLVLSSFNVSAEKTNEVVDALLENSAVGIKISERIQVLDSPAAYVAEW